MEEDLTREAGHEQVKRGLMIRLLHHLCEDYTIQLHTDSKESREKAFLFELERYIQKNYATVTTSQLEAKFHYHRNYYHSSEKIQRQNLPAICDGRSDEVCAAAIRANYPAG